MKSLNLECIAWIGEAYVGTGGDEVVVDETSLASSIGGSVYHHDYHMEG